MAFAGSLSHRLSAVALAVAVLLPGLHARAQSSPREVSDWQDRLWAGSLVGLSLGLATWMWVAGARAPDVGEDAESPMPGLGEVLGDPVAITVGVVAAGVGFLSAYASTIDTDTRDVLIGLGAGSMVLLAGVVLSGVWYQTEPTVRDHEPTAGFLKLGGAMTASLESVMLLVVGIIAAVDVADSEDDSGERASGLSLPLITVSF
jgi:hypothetical protein